MEAESIECFIEDQAFPPSYNFAPSPPPPLSSQIDSLSQSSCVSSVDLTDGDGGGGGRGGETNHTMYSINHSILSGWRCYLQQTFGHILNSKTTVYYRLFASWYLVFSKRITIDPIKALVLQRYI
jgi:hypothetical protein